MFCPIDGKELKFIGSRNKRLYYMCDNGHVWEVKKGSKSGFELKELFTINKNNLTTLALSEKNSQKQ